MKAVFVTSSSQQDQIMAAAYPIYNSEDFIPHTAVRDYLASCKVITRSVKIPADFRKYLNRYMPTTTEEVEDLINFRKHRRKSIKLRRKFYFPDPTSQIEYDRICREAFEQNIRDFEASQKYKKEKLEASMKVLDVPLQLTA